VSWTLPRLAPCCGVRKVGRLSGSVGEGRRALPRVSKGIGSGVDGGCMVVTGVTLDASWGLYGVVVDVVRVIQALLHGGRE